MNKSAKWYYKIVFDNLRSFEKLYSGFFNFVLMAKIILEGMLFKSHIGVYDYEQMYGNNFEVELVIESAAIESVEDEITRTIDYDHLYSIVQQVMSGRYKLIETACKHIIDTIKIYNIPSEKIKVRIAKLHPPLGGEVKKVWIEMEG